MDGARPLRVVIGSIGMNPGTNLVGNHDLVTQYQRTHAIVKALTVDIPLGSHGAMFGLAQKHAALVAAPGGPNPYVDPDGYARAAVQTPASVRGFLVDGDAELADVRIGRRPLERHVRRADVRRQEAAAAGAHAAARFGLIRSVR